MYYIYIQTTGWLRIYILIGSLNIIIIIIIYYSQLLLPFTPSMLLYQLFFRSSASLSSSPIFRLSFFTMSFHVIFGLPLSLLPAISKLSSKHTLLARLYFFLKHLPLVLLFIIHLKILLNYLYIYCISVYFQSSSCCIIINILLDVRLNVPKVTFLPDDGWKVMLGTFNLMSSNRFKTIRSI